MTEFNAKIIIDQQNIHEILENFDISDDIENWVDRNLDIDSEISNWMNYHFDIDDYIRDIDFSQYLENSDVEDSARSLLEQYSPVASCSTGQAFTEAVGKAIRYLLLNDEYVDYLVKALERNNRAKMKQDIENEIRAKLSDELKNQHFAEFKAELEKLNTASVNEVNIITAQNHINNTTTFSY